jgi:hypothetical protein
MKVREAVAAAKQHIREFFADEPIQNLGLEEVEFDDTSNTWLVTFGFSRPWDKPTGGILASLEIAGQELKPWRRDYKVVRISNDTGDLISIKNRESSNVS